MSSNILVRYNSYAIHILIYHVQDLERILVRPLGRMVVVALYIYCSSLTHHHQYNLWFPKIITFAKAGYDHHCFWFHFNKNLTCKKDYSITETKNYLQL